MLFITKCRRRRDDATFTSSHYRQSDPSSDGNLFEPVNRSASRFTDSILREP